MIFFPKWIKSQIAHNESFYLIQNIDILLKVLLFCHLDTPLRYLLIVNNCWWWGGGGICAVAIVSVATRYIFTYYNEMKGNIFLYLLM